MKEDMTFSNWLTKKQNSSRYRGNKKLSPMSAESFGSGASIEEKIAAIYQICEQIQNKNDEKSIEKFIRDGFLQKPFNQWARDTTVADVFWCFRLILGRAPSEEEWKAHLTRVGGDLTSTVNSYLDSREFSERNLFSSDWESSVKCKTINDYMLFLHEDDNVITLGIISGSYEAEVVSIFTRLLKPGMNVIDIGANIGFFSMLAASMVGPNGRVLAVEPNGSNVRLLEASRRANRFYNIDVAFLALTDTTSVLVLNAGESNGTTSTPEGAAEVMQARTLVPAVPLDSLVGERWKTDFIKIDVEGAEMKALSGATSLLRRDKPIIVSEFSPGALRQYSGVTGKDYLEFIIGFGYEVSVIERDGSWTSCGDDVEKIMGIFTRRLIDHIDIIAMHPDLSFGNR